MKANDEKLNLNLRLSLVSSVSWVTVPDHLVLMNTGLFKLLWCLKGCHKTSSVHFTFATKLPKIHHAKLSPRNSGRAVLNKH